MIALVFSASACERSSGGDAAASLAGGTRIFQETFEGSGLSERWSGPESAWRVSDGVLHAENAQNAALWLDVPLPERVRVEFDATAESAEGDLKCEIFGNGRDHQSGYIVIYGGWNNTVTCIARLDEHGADRLDAREHVPVVPGQAVHFAIVRKDERLHFYRDGQLVLTYEDSAPLVGPDHRFFAFNEWDAPVFFDNLEIYELP